MLNHFVKFGYSRCRMLFRNLDFCQGYCSQNNLTSVRTRAFLNLILLHCCIRTPNLTHKLCFDYRVTPKLSDPSKYSNLPLVYWSLRSGIKIGIFTAESICRFIYRLHRIELSEDFRELVHSEVSVYLHEVCPV